MFPAMRGFIHRLLLILCALAFLGGTTVGLATHPAAAGELCADHQDGAADHHHDKGGNCLTCCVGVCVAVPDLPTHAPSSLAPLTAIAVAYSSSGVTISGRSIAPDPAPPRFSA